MRMSTLKIVYIYRSNTWSETFTRKSLRHSKFRQIEWAVVRGNKEKYDQIRTAILRHHLGKKPKAIKKDNPLIYAWITKYAILDVGETPVLVERPKDSNKKKNTTTSEARGGRE